MAVRPAITARTDTLTTRSAWRGVAWLFALVLLPGIGSYRAQAQESAESALPQLPAKIRAQLEAEQLRREIALEQLRRQLEELKGTEDTDVQEKIERLGKLLRLLEVDQDVRELLEDAPEMAREYDRILRASSLDRPTTPQGPCACLELARVHWLGEGDQAGQVTVYLGGGYYDVRAGDAIGSSRCSLGQTLPDSVVLQCGNERAFRGLYNPVDRTSQTSQ